MSWYLEKETHIADIEVSYMSGVTGIHGRLIDGVWEYAIVRYYHTIPTLILEWKEDKVTVDNHECY